MKYSFVTKRKGEVEMEFDEKEVPVALEGVLKSNGVDAYTYEPHPLKEGFRLHIEADDAQGELKKAVDEMEKQWTQFHKALKSKLK